MEVSDIVKNSCVYSVHEGFTERGIVFVVGDQNAEVGSISIPRTYGKETWFLRS